MNNKQQQVKILRILGFGEAISWLFLLLIAMPLKYLAGKPLMVTYTGWVHGLLFMLYLGQLLYVKTLLKWPFKTFLLGCIYAFFPFGTLIFDKKLRNVSEAAAIL